MALVLFGLFAWIGGILVWEIINRRKQGLNPKLAMLILFTFGLGLLVLSLLVSLSSAT